jgi:tRNA A-37 threonylcarbamoyl transferase component Bud32
MVNIIHGHGVFHQDLIASNFLIKDSSAGDLQLRIIDFEFAELAT